eukprot:1145048-Pelagomonas_calceolata.AAC.2
MVLLEYLQQLTLRSRGTSGEAFSLIVRDALVCITNRLAMPWRNAQDRAKLSKTNDRLAKRE